MLIATLKCIVIFLRNKIAFSICLTQKLHAAHILTSIVFFPQNWNLTLLNESENRLFTTYFLNSWLECMLRCTLLFS